MNNCPTKFLFLCVILTSAYAEPDVECHNDLDCSVDEICENTVCVTGCRNDANCRFEEACINHYCQNPCSACGQNAICKAINHDRVCTCSPGYTGNPHTLCSRGLTQLFFENDGPTVLDTSTTFFSFLSNSSHGTDICYIFDDGMQKHEIVTNTTNATLVAAFMSDAYRAGTFIMNITAKDCETNSTIATNHTTFLLKDYLIGKIVVNRDAEGLEDVSEVAVGENVTMAVELHDPNDNFLMAQSDYSWSIDYEPTELSFKNISYNYSSPEMSRISVVVSEKLSANMMKFGYFSKNLTVKVPVNSVNISGNPFIHHGEILNLDISCNGSVPFLYCAQPLKPYEVASNFSCHSPITSTTCGFHFQYYFRNYGKYQVGIFISNDVKTVRRVLEVYVYNVSKKPQLSTVIIPIVCSLLTLCIIAGAIAFHIQQRNQLAIEVANFDFQEESLDLHSSSTFFERILQACSCRVCNYKVEDNLDVEDEEEPLINSYGSSQY